MINGDTEIRGKTVTCYDSKKKSIIRVKIQQ